ncbi:unnamed protein product [Arctia plantaginis]|uniref:Uncharacterized protein n=1 Tax=Arctia plantaginis TaxID=874455 RepID=A0A8S0ZLY3_ARCPL|nr:unnamed protein product [Arctia plantaginis]
MSHLRREEYEMTIVEASNSAIDNELVVNPRNLIRQASACYGQKIEELNVIESEDVHIGISVISVSQNVENIELARGCALGAELVTNQKRKGVRCSIAVFLCWTLVITGVLIYFVFYFALAPKLSRMDLDIDEPWYFRRDQWYANPDQGFELLDLPVSLVLIGHSALDFCTKIDECKRKVLDIQEIHQLDSHFYDIGPNFLVGGNGYVFEGRGANIMGAMITYFNLKSISIMFLGNYVYDKPTLAMFDNLSVLLQELVNKRVLTTDYKLYGQCQVIGFVVPPGPNVMDNLHHFDHWDPTNKTFCIRS